MIEVDRFGDVTRIKMGREVQGRVLYWTAAYLVDSLLVDTGCSYTADELTQFLAGQHLRLAVNTHHHEDHIGANHQLQQHFKIPIMASRESAPFINQRPILQTYQEIVWGYPLPTKVDILPTQVETDSHRFEVIQTPGHSAGHVALVETNEGWCFSGDLFISREPKSIRPHEDVAEVAKSMQRLADLPTRRLTLFTSPGNVVEDGREALRACVGYLRGLSQQAKELQKQGLAAAAIRDQLFGRESVLAGLTDGDISSENMVRALLRADIPE